MYFNQFDWWIARVYTERSHYYCLNSGENENSSLACVCRSSTYCRDGLYRSDPVVLRRVATEVPISGPNSLFIRVLVDKKFELPYKVVDALVFHFIRLSNSYKARTRGDSAKLPVLWHQSLLVFAQRLGLFS